MNEYIYPVIFGVIAGTLTRIYRLKTDYRQYPNCLHGKIIHISMGFIASALGSIAIPVIMEKLYRRYLFNAGRFAVSRNSQYGTMYVPTIDQYELVPRGATYIEGIADALESRNYLFIFISFFTTLLYLLFHFIVAVIGAILYLLISRALMSGGKLGKIVDIEYIEPHVESAGLYVGNIYLMNIGLTDRRKRRIKIRHGTYFNTQKF